MPEAWPDLGIELRGTRIGRHVMLVCSELAIRQTDHYKGKETMASNKETIEE